MEPTEKALAPFARILTRYHAGCDIANTDEHHPNLSIHGKAFFHNFLKNAKNQHIIRCIIKDLLTFAPPITF